MCQHGPVIWAWAAAEVATRWRLAATPGPSETPLPTPDPSDVQIAIDTDPTSGGQGIGSGDLLMLTVAIVLATAFSVALYRAMQKPRLRLVFDDEKSRWTATRRDLVQYAISMPILVLMWYLYFTVLLFIAPNKLSALGLLLVPAAFILSVRFLAHIWHEAAHNLGKAVPLILVTSVLLTWSTKSDADFERLAQSDDNLSPTWPFLLTLLFIDYIFTACWFFIGARRWALRGFKVPGIPWQKFPQSKRVQVSREDLRDEARDAILGRPPPDESPPDESPPDESPVPPANRREADASSDRPAP